MFYLVCHVGIYPEDLPTILQVWNNAARVLEGTLYEKSVKNVNEEKGEKFLLSRLQSQKLKVKNKICFWCLDTEILIWSLSY